MTQTNEGQVRFQTDLRPRRPARPPLPALQALDHRPNPQAVAAGRPPALPPLRQEGVAVMAYERRDADQDRAARGRTACSWICP